MAEKFQFDLVGPEKILVSSEVESVIAPGSEGDFQILRQHAPFMCVLRPGVVTVQNEGADEQKFYISGGIADAGPRWLSILVMEARPLEELKAEDLELQIKNAREDLEDAKDDATRNKAETLLNQLQNAKEVLALN